MKISLSLWFEAKTRKKLALNKKRVTTAIFKIKHKRIIVKNNICFITRNYIYVTVMSILLKIIAPST